ncbi:MAG: PD-(D/E)XK nuclease family protein [Thermoguttaceae bacterium]|nr:PD-(D/E)XK nuclease family protein [Thermoguttaceae bacterium]
MKIHLTFGQELDSARWSGEDASLGCQTLGLTGMLEFLEHKLGILDKESVPAVRIAQYQRKLREYYDRFTDKESVWGYKSFKADAWSTAKQLLAWRDELIEGGWDPGTYEGGVSERLDVLAAVENTGPKLDPGPSDRLREILRKLNELNKGETTLWPVELTLAHPKELFPPVWQEILDELPKVVTFGDDPPNMDSSVKEYLDETKEVIQLEGNSQAELARHLVRYLTAAKKSRKLSKITLLACGDTRVLDGALHKGGFGAVGNVSPSAGRPSLALLTLFFSVMWKPIRVEQLYELIASPYLGIPNKGLILGAIENAPGVGSEEWNKAWDNALTGGENNEKYKDLREWLKNPLEENASASDLNERCEWLHERLEEQKNKGYPELGTTLTALGGLKSALEQSDGESFTLIQLARAIESAIGSGTPPANTEREATKFKIATNPGMVDTTETLLWFDCVRSDPPRPTRWSKSERQYFETVNIVTDTAERRRKLDAYYRKRAFKKTKERFIFFVPKTIDGEEVPRATFLNEVDYALDPKLGDEAKKHIIKAESLTDNETGKWQLADQKLLLEKDETGEIDPEKAKVSQCLYTIPPVTIDEQYRFSYSQLKTLLSCPLRWVLDNYLALKDKVPVKIEDALDKGKFAHKVIEKLVENRHEWEEADVRQLTDEKFFEQLPKCGGRLNYEEHAADRENTRQAIGIIAEELFKQFRKWKIKRVSTEQKIEDRGITIAGHPLTGFIDLLAEEDGEKKHVLDLKYSFSTKYMKPEDEQYNSAVLQLATYTQGLDNAGASFVLIPRRTIEQEQNPKLLEDLWKLAEERLKECLEKLRKGEFNVIDKNDAQDTEKTDEQGENKDPFPRDCKYCNHSWICGIALGNQPAEQTEDQAE